MVVIIFLGKKFFELLNNILKKIPILRTIYSAIGQMTESFTKKIIEKKVLFYWNIQEKEFG